MSEKQIRDCKVLIIGSGPAGLSAAIYTGRAGLSPVIISGPTFGGQASLTADIENYPGFVDSVSGSELMDKFREQAEKFGAEIVSDIVEKVDFIHRTRRLLLRHLRRFLLPQKERCCCRRRQLCRGRSGIPDPLCRFRHHHPPP